MLGPGLLTNKGYIPSEGEDLLVWSIYPSGFFPPY